MLTEGIEGRYLARGGKCVAGRIGAREGVGHEMLRGRVDMLFVGIELFARQVVLTSLVSSPRRDFRCFWCLTLEIKNLLEIGLMIVLGNFFLIQTLRPSHRADSAVETRSDSTKRNYEGSQTTKRESSNDCSKK